VFADVLLFAALQIGPFYEQSADRVALHPVFSVSEEATDVLWPVFSAHRDWWSFLLVVNWQKHVRPDGYQFSVVPFWFNGRDEGRGSYAGLFPVYGYHPRLLTVYDLRFALWPLWTSYRRPRGDGWLETKTVLFPFVSWRSDGSWSVWPVYGVNRQRESSHRYAFWPFFTWASYREDRDTAGEGASWMAWPFYGRVRRARESQDLVLPPFFSYATTTSRATGERESVRLRCPWPFFTYESTPFRARVSLWPLYERETARDPRSGEAVSRVTRFGWKLIELYDDETRVFPFYASGRGHTRVWPFYESESAGGTTVRRVLALVPIRWVPAIDRNWAKYWTFYESATEGEETRHSLLWGLIRWRTRK
jgi:hypothetical protein